MLDQTRMIAILTQQIGVLSSEIKALKGESNTTVDIESLESASLGEYSIEMQEDGNSTEEEETLAAARHLDQIPLANLFKKREATTTKRTDKQRQFKRSQSCQQFETTKSSSEEETEESERIIFKPKKTTTDCAAGGQQRRRLARTSLDDSNLLKVPT